MALTTERPKARRHQTITPSDSETLDETIEAILVIGAGDVSIEDRFGTVIVYPSVPAYTTLEGFVPLRIRATGTTSTNIVAWSTHPEIF